MREFLLFDMLDNVDCRIDMLIRETSRCPALKDHSLPSAQPNPGPGASTR
jgi:hypothetical protein